jgi:hypothetical protein
MRNVILLDNADASTQQISAEVNLERRTDWELVIESDSLDGTPNLFIEKGYNAGKCNPLPTEWFIEPNVCKVTNEFPIEDTEIQIVKNGFTANWFRVRVEPNDNTTGNITVTIHYKTYP